MTYLIHRSALVLLCLVFINSLYSQVRPVQRPYAAPGLVNFSALAKLGVIRPERLKQVAVEQGEDRFEFRFKPQPVPANAVSNKLSTSPAARIEAPVISPAPIRNFPGVADNGTIIPPDIDGVAGKLHLLQTTNQEFRIFTKAGLPAGTLSIPSFFWATGGSGYYDPHVAYDPASDKFIISIDGKLANGNGGIFLAVSQTGDPTGNWFTYSIDATGNASDFLDYPQLGFNNNWIVVTGINYPSSGAAYAKIFVFSKAGIYAGTAGAMNTFTDNASSLLSPATTYDATQSAEYLVSNWNGNYLGIGYVRVAAITGAVGSPLYSTVNTIGVNQPWNDATINAPQAGSTNVIEDGDTRIQSCVYRNGSLWFTHTVFLPAGGVPKYAAADWWQVNPALGSVIQFGRLSDSTGQSFYYYPSLDVNTNNDMLLGFTTSSPNLFAGSGYALHAAADAANSLQAPYICQSGLSAYYKTFGSGRNRWGDFSGTAYDPVDNTIWTFQEWANLGNNWASQIAQVPTAVAPVCTVPVSLPATNATANSIVLHWKPTAAATGYGVQYRLSGGTAWTSLSTVDSSITINGLAAGSDYEWQVQAICSASSNSGFGATAFFSTLKACGLPSGLLVSVVTTNTAVLTWLPVPGATAYIIQWRAAGATAFSVLNGVLLNTYLLTNLTPGTSYEFQVQAVCSSGSSAFSSIASFATAGDIYCKVKGNTLFEYIKTVQLGDLQHTGGDGGGYGNFTGLSTNLTAGQDYAILLTPGYPSSFYKGYFSVYIDYNHNGILDDKGEMVISGKEKSKDDGAVSATFTVPANAISGLTRLRVQLNHKSKNNSPCDSPDYGDVQDYTVNIVNGGLSGGSLRQSAVVSTGESNSLKVIPNPVTSRSGITVVYHLTGSGNVSLKLVDISGKIRAGYELGLQASGDHNYLLNIAHNKLQSGYYILVMEQENKLLSKTRFMVNN